MDPKQIWKVFLCVVALFAAVLATKGVIDFQRYRALTSHTLTTHIAWSTERSWRGTLYPQAAFRYYVDQQEYSGTTVFYDHAFRNPAATDEALARMGSEPRAVYYDADRPQNASLTPRFPWKSVFSGGLALIIFFYFVAVSGRVYSS